MGTTVRLSDAYLSRGPVSVNGVKLTPTSSAAVVLYPQVYAIASSNAAMAVGTLRPGFAAAVPPEHAAAERPDPVRQLRTCREERERARWVRAVRRREGRRDEGAEGVRARFADHSQPDAAPLPADRRLRPEVAGPAPRHLGSRADPRPDADRAAQRRYRRARNPAVQARVHECRERVARQRQGVCRQRLLPGHDPAERLGGDQGRLAQLCRRVTPLPATGRAALPRPQPPPDRVRHGSRPDALHRQREGGRAQPDRGRRAAIRRVPECGDPVLHEPGRGRHRLPGASLREQVHASDVRGERGRVRAGAR